MEEIEVPTEGLHEEMQHHAEHSSSQQSWISWVALSSALFAALAWIVIAALNAPPIRAHVIAAAPDGSFPLTIDEPSGRKIQPVHECVDEPHRVVEADIVVHRFREQQGLRSVVTRDVRHGGILPAPSPRWNPSGRVFTRSA